MSVPSAMSINDLLRVISYDLVSKSHGDAAESIWQNVANPSE